MSSAAPGSQFEPRQSDSSADLKPNPSKSLPLPPARQALLDDILALYSCNPTRARIERYTPDCVYDDLFGYADNRYKVAGQWFALPKLFSKSESAGYEVTRSDDEVLQFKNEQKWTFRLIPKTVTLPGLITLSLDPETVHSEFIRVKYHKDQASGKDYDHEGIGFTLKKWQADNVAGWINDENVKYFEKDNVSQKKK
ncbi:hypothetical protein AAL_07341 [Moelleriella libera RCEF 2490]|uniref:FAD dependent oxidoreductase n=1 Tax=Moelleriella libera RCEF 2490 TaxID=1081109 RepID=A0A166NII4_9HYPO|nr:hypothetical protein AAL_07341 [Moelleriella libera RCEF 2490]